jgi:nicotinamidase-related amidase
VKVKASYYQHFDLDPDRDVPAEGFGGWQQTEIEIAPEHTAVVVMHAWDTGTPEQYPGWHRCLEYITRADRIVREVFPPLLAAVRESDLPLFHVAGGGGYAGRYPGYQRAVELAGPEPAPPEQIQPDPVLTRLRQFRDDHVFVGRHNQEDVRRGFRNIGFPPEAEPLGDEGVAENAHQLFALCRDAGVNHLIYAGFAIDMCLLISAGGMADMARHGLMCSALRQAVTAVEHKETARHELAKEVALWRVAVVYGFVFDVDDFIAALRRG